jgi:hypothetical protein
MEGKNIRSFRVLTDKEDVFVDLRQRSAPETTEHETAMGLWPVAVTGSGN